MPSPTSNLDFYNYNLPEELIAQKPVENRDQSRLLVYSREAEAIQHKLFSDILPFLNNNDVLVVNNCKVIPARLFAIRADTGTEIEVLLTKNIKSTKWQAMVKPGRSCKIGVKLIIGKITAEIIGIKENGERVILFNCSENDFPKLLDTNGTIPLPPYIKRPHTPSSKEDRERYQTVYAAEGQAVAAPTAGLHFTEQLIEKIKNKGCEFLSVTLNVGPGTFAPVKSSDITKHLMHSEEFVLTQEIADKLNNAKKAGKRIVAVGTTSLRVLESCINEKGMFEAASRATDIFIYPPYEIRSIDALITNFHLPKSTLLMLIASFTGESKWQKIYSEAIKNKYRFFSYGDAMLLQ